MAFKKCSIINCPHGSKIFITFANMRFGYCRRHIKYSEMLLKKRDKWTYKDQKGGTIHEAQRALAAA